MIIWNLQCTQLASLQSTNYMLINTYMINYQNVRTFRALKNKVKPTKETGGKGEENDFSI